MNRVQKALIDVIETNHNMPLRKSDRQRKMNIFNTDKCILTNYYEEARVNRISSGREVAGDEEIALYLMRQLVSLTEITVPMNSYEFEQYVSDCLKTINDHHNQL